MERCAVCGRLGVGGARQEEDGPVASSQLQEELPRTG